MQFYITLVVLLSFIYSVQMRGGNSRAPVTTRLRITSRGFTLQSLPRQPTHTINNLPRPVDSFKESHYPLTRLRFAASTTRSRVSVSTSTSNDDESSEMGSLVRVHIHELVSITHLSSSLALSLTFSQGISSFAILALVITNIWGGEMLQPPR
jgi:hypothetical protein